MTTTPTTTESPRSPKASPAGTRAEALLNQLAAAEPGWHAEPAWLRELRARAAATFRDVGVPTTRLEYWKHTNPAALARTPFKTSADAVPPTVRESVLPDAGVVDLPGAVRLVFVNGAFAPHLSSDTTALAGIELHRLRDVLAAEAPERLAAELGQLATFDAPEQSFAALNTALFRDGVYLRVGRNQDVRSTPIHIVHLELPSEAPRTSYPRLFVVAETGCEATVVESYVSLAEAAAPSCNVAVAELHVEAGATLRHAKVVYPAGHALYVARTEARVGRDATYRNHTVDFGAALSRNDLAARLVGEGAHAHLHGLSVLGENRHADNHTVLDHQVPHGTADELYKHILDDKSHAVFYGRIIVRPGAQQTDAVQNNRTVLLSDEAKIDAMPQLEIYADDVKCTHGATAGALDAEEMFYLRSRGLDDAKARSLLTFAFASDVLDGIEPEALRGALADRLYRK